ncbi:interferon alpha-inducible protein 27-like protein 2 [Oreochromis aureus]|uniref:interferon alpha-inducible protein 27-like protein 2 n=1 Tax=Oreochromis aureus TaxID=47969 RepID=UPI001953F1FD|nr:interferon alpha-inducible protein 27-like protein 2 [Oreochromis aureus]
MGLLTAAAIAAGAGGAVVSAPIVLGGCRFHLSWNSSWFLRCKLDVCSCYSQWRRVAAGSAVAVLQSAGMAGLSGAATAAVGTVGGAVGGLVAALI